MLPVPQDEVGEKQDTHTVGVASSRSSLSAAQCANSLATMGILVWRLCDRLRTDELVACPVPA